MTRHRSRSLSPTCSRSKRPWQSNCSFPTPLAARCSEGVDILAHAVGTTLGPTGRNVILSKSFGGPTVTKDGVTVSKEIELADPFENMGAKLVNVVASKTSDVAGDGTTTATILARAIYREGLQEHHLGRQPHGRPPRDREGRRGGRGRASRQALAAGLQEGRDRPGRLDLGEQRPDDRQRCWPTPSSGSAATA